MRILLLAAVLSVTVKAADVPFFLRDLTTQRDVAGLNENFRATTDAIRKSDLTSGGTVSGDLTSNRVCFPDGTCMSSAVSTDTSTVYASSQTLVPSGSYANTINSVCIATVTFTPGNLPLAVTYIGAMSLAAPTQNEIGWGYLINGAYGPGQNATTGVTAQSIIATSLDSNMSATDHIPAQGSGPISFCLTVFAIGGSVVIPATHQFTSRAQFIVSNEGHSGGAGGSVNLTGPVTSIGAATTIVGPVPAAAVDLSTVTTALALKVDKNTPAQVDLSTVTTALALKLDKAGGTMTGSLTMSNNAIFNNSSSGPQYFRSGVTSGHLGFIFDDGGDKGLGIYANGVTFPYGISGGSATLTGLVSAGSVTVTGSGGYITGQSSITTTGGVFGAAGKFIGTVEGGSFLATGGNSVTAITHQGQAGVQAQFQGNGAGLVLRGSASSGGITINNDSVSRFGSSITLSGSFHPAQYTRAQIDVLPIQNSGGYIDCTDCTLPGLCRSTGTVASQYRKIESATLGCGTGN